MMCSATDLLQARLLSRIAWLLWAIVLVLLMAFCFFASSFCITLLLAAFLAATAGILFWGWLWGLMGILLAVPLTAFVKIVADCHPSLIHVSNLLAESPRPIPSFIDSGRDTIYKTVPFIRKGFPAKVKL
jgi:predicted PurR-regulated permease PerM